MHFQRCCNTFASYKPRSIILHDGLPLMLQNFKKLLRFFMSDKPPNIYCLFPQNVIHSNAFYWTNSILGRDFPNHQFVLSGKTRASQGRQTTETQISQRILYSLLERESLQNGYDR